MNERIDQETIIRSVAESIQGTGLPAAPPLPADHAVYGEIRNSLADELKASIERACEATIAEMYRSVEHAEKKAAAMRANADSFAVKLREYASWYTGGMGDLLAYCAESEDTFTAHAKAFEERIAGKRAENGAGGGAIRQGVMEGVSQ
jgi:hypothetical protein